MCVSSVQLTYELVPSVVAAGRFSFLRLVHVLNVVFPIVVSSGIEIDSNDVQLSNVDVPEIETRAGRSTSTRS